MMTNAHDDSWDVVEWNRPFAINGPGVASLYEMLRLGEDALLNQVARNLLSSR